MGYNIMKPRIIFIGASEIIKSSVFWLAAKNHSFVLLTDQVQSAKCSFFGVLSPEHKIVSNDGSVVSDFRFQENDIAISVGSPWFLEAAFIKSFPGRALLNLHGSQLPLYRGGNLYSWYVLNSVRVGMTLLHHMSAIIDEGPIAFYDEFLYPSSCKKPSDYIEAYEKANSEFLLQKIQEMISGAGVIPKNAQPHYLSTYWPRLRSDVNGWIDWDIEGPLLERFISAFDDPYDGAITTWRKLEVRLKGVYFQPGFNHHPFQNGIVFRNNGKWLNVAVQGGELIVCGAYVDDEPAGLSAFKVGDRFITPFERLDESKVRVIKGKHGLSVQRNR